MKIKTKVSNYETVSALPRATHINPKKPSVFFRTLIRVASIPDLMSAHFGIEGTPELPSEPSLILMNHSSFIDLEIASKLLFPRPYCIVCTSDGLVGKEWLMRYIGCIPTQKFVSDITLIRDIIYAIKVKKTSVLMFPEASYSFDGRATPLPRKLGVLLKRLDVPITMIRTHGAFLRDPLYGGLRKRKTKVSAEVSELISRTDIAEKTTDELDAILDSAFDFDNFREQYDRQTEISEPFRAEGLERILYKCAACHSEECMVGSGTRLVCSNCGKKYEMTTFGRLSALDSRTEFPHIPDWYTWERECVRKELISGSYELDTDVEIGMMVDYKSIYMIGEGHLVHNREGFHLTGGNGKLDYYQKPLASYGLYADYFWYEIGDVICIGDKNALYYCFPKKKGVAAKTRLAAEELYKLEKEKVKPLKSSPQ